MKPLLNWVATMADKQLADKAINIKGKQYVLVSDRVTFFNENYPEGSIETSYELVGDMFIVKATVKPNRDQTFTGHSQAIIGDGMVNKVAALENCETSAVGRALGLMGIGVIESIASVDEINKAQGSQGGVPKPPSKRRATTEQMGMLVKKVGWAFKSYDKDEAIGYVESVIGKLITDLMSDEVDEAIKKLDKAIRDDKLMQALEPEPTKKPDLEKGEGLEDIPEATRKAIQDGEIDLDKIPF